MSEEFETPPMSGDGNLPIKELKPEPKLDSSKKEEKLTELRPREMVLKNKKFFYPLMITAIFLVFLMGLGLGLLAKRKPKIEKTLVTPEPTVLPLVAPTPSSWKKDLEKKIGKFDEDLTNIDLQESQLAPPILDFNIKFEVKD